MADTGNSRNRAPLAPVPITDPRRLRLLRHVGYAQAARTVANDHAESQAKAEAVQRSFKRLKQPYEQSLIRRPSLADLLKSRHLDVEQAIGAGLWSEAELALATFETALRTPPSGEAVLLDAWMSKAPKQVVAGTPLVAEPTLLGTEEQLAADLKDQQGAQAQAAAVQLSLRRLKLQYDQALIKRPTLANLLKARYEAVQKAIAANSWAATEALAKLDAALRTPPSGEAALLEEGLTKAAKTAVTGTPLTADATLLGTTEQAASDVKQQQDEQATQQRRAELEQLLQTLDGELVRDKLYDTSLGGDLKILKTLAIQQLTKRPLDWSHLTEAEALLKEVRIKADFIRKQGRQTQSRRNAMATCVDALQIKPGGADQLLNDKSLKAGGHFTDFAKALKDFETEPSAKRRAELVKRIDSYLRHADKFSDSDKAKAENQRKRQAVMKVQGQLAAQQSIQAQQQLMAKGDWTRDDQSKATEHYLNMMLLLGEAPPKNLKGENAKELVLAVRGISGVNELVVKPQMSEIPVAGFTAGGGASREMLASAVGDKLQEMLGLDLNVAPTKVVKVDGGLIGLEPGEPVVASAQAFAARSQELSAKFAEGTESMGVIPLAEVQNKAVFDLIALHCDRHAKNFMVGDDNKLIPIDHGNVLPNKEGLLARSSCMGPPAAILSMVPQAKEKLSPDLIERIQRLNSNELIESMQLARAQMPEGADVGGGDLDEGIENSKRSIEFLKFACSELTLRQIQVAYGRSTADIFFTDEDGKAAGFARAVKFAQSFWDAYDQLVGMLTGAEFNGMPYFTELHPQFKALGWFVNGSSDLQGWVTAHPQQALEILARKIKYKPTDEKAAEDAKAAKAMPPPKFFKSQELKTDGDKALWSRYVAVGGDAGWMRAGGDDNATLADRTATMEQARYLALGGDIAWMSSGLGDPLSGAVPLHERVAKLTGFAGVDAQVLV